VSTIAEDAIDEQTRPNPRVEPGPERPPHRRIVEASALAGASPAVPRDPRLLKAEEADYVARRAAEDAESARIAAEEAAARAEATRRAAEKTRAELEAARAEAKAKAEAAALQVRLEQEEIDRQAAVARVQQRALRDEQLGVRTVEVSEPEVITVTRRSTDQPLGALALLLVRLTVAGWIGILGWQVLVDRQAVTDVLTDVGIPSAMTSWMSWSAGIAMFAVALFLLFGVATRAFAGILAAFLVAFLALFRFGPFSPFLEGQFGFYGDREVFITVLCLVLVLLGAGGWSADARIRRRRKAVHRQD